MGLGIKYVLGQTKLSNEELEGLKIKSIANRAELDEFEQLNIEKAIEWTLSLKIKPEQLFTEKFILNIHKKMYSDVWKWAGSFRKSEKNIGIKSYLIGVAVKQLLDDSFYWFENKTYSNEEIAIRFKHRIVSIHCFPNGNGRHSRLFADLIMTKLFNKKYFTWGNSNLVKADEVRETYIKALKEADNQNFAALIKFAKL